MAQKNFADAMNQIVNGTNGLKSQINVKADKHSPNFTGVPTAPTAGNNTDSTQLATTEFVQNLIRRLCGVDTDTIALLADLANALLNEPDFRTAVVEVLDSKLNKTDAANTYATKAELSNVSVDTTNLAKTNASNTFTSQQTFNGGIKLGNGTSYTLLTGGSDFDLRVNSNPFHVFTSNGGLIVGNSSSSGNFVNAQFNWNNDGKLVFNAPNGVYAGTKRLDADGTYINASGTTTTTGGFTYKFQGYSYMMHDVSGKIAQICFDDNGGITIQAQDKISLMGDVYVNGTKIS